MPPLRLQRFVAMLLLGVGWLRVCGAEADLSAQGWDDASMLLVQDAYAKFTAAHGRKDGDSREIDYGLAVSLLNLQPKTSSNIDRAAQLFTQITAANPDDELGIASLYFLARLEQVHRSTPDVPKALALYGHLVDRHPEHLLAQLAVTKIAILKLYNSPLNSNKRKALAEIEKLAPLLKDPLARANFDYIVGTACIRFKLGDQKAMDYLIEADRIGIPVEILASHALVRIGNLATRLGQRDVAIAYFERFVQEFPRDIRNFTVRQKLVELKGNAG